jgi:hypothetical protein
LHKISDVVLHLRYTSRDGGQALRAAALATGEQGNRLKQRVRVFSARGDFQVQWAKFVQGEADPADGNRLELPIAARHFWSFFGESRVKIVAVHLSATFAEKHNPPSTFSEGLPITIEPPDVTAVIEALAFVRGEPSVSISEAEDLPVGAVQREDEAAFVRWLVTVPHDDGGAPTPAPIRVQDGARKGLLKPDALEDIWLHVVYEKYEEAP